MRVLLKYFSLGLSLVRQPPTSEVVLLMYHRVTGDTSLELDLPFNIFQAQMRWLKTQNVRPLDEVLLPGFKSRDGRPTYVITFDDAYEDFYTLAFPLFKELGLPATLYVPTGFIDSPQSIPISKEIDKPNLLKPMSWDMLRELCECPLITIGGHTVTHREMTSLSDEEIIEEIRACNFRLKEQLGLEVAHFAYPRGVWDERVESLVSPQYSSVALADNHKRSFIRTRLSRVPILRSDGWWWFQHRIAGRLDYEAKIVSKVKQMSKLINFRFST